MKKTSIIFLMIFSVLSIHGAQASRMSYFSSSYMLGKWIVVDRINENRDIDDLLFGQRKNTHNTDGKETLYTFGRRSNYPQLGKCSEIKYQYSKGIIFRKSHPGPISQVYINYWDFRKYKPFSTDSSIVYKLSCTYGNQHIWTEFQLLKGGLISTLGPDFIIMRRIKND
jgi:hypothetical protein